MRAPHRCSRSAIAWVGFLMTRLRLRRSVPAVPDTPDALFSTMAAADATALSFGDRPGTPFPGPAARRWAYGVLYECGVDADADPGYAAQLLMRAEPRLTRRDADALIRVMLG